MSSKLMIIISCAVSWSILILVMFNISNSMEMSKYNNCVNKRFIPNECDDVFVGGQPIFRCARVVDMLLTCEDDGFIYECNEKSFHICNAVLIDYFNNIRSPYFNERKR